MCVADPVLPVCHWLNCHSEADAAVSHTSGQMRDHFCCSSARSRPFLRPARLNRAIENLQNFSLNADPSFRHFQLDVSKELKLLTELNFIQGEEGAAAG